MGTFRIIASSNQFGITPTQTTVHQAGVIAYRVEKARVEVLLITSRDTGRWIIPKGNIEDGKTAMEASAQEAYEEAGVRGNFSSQTPLGFYMYFKRRADGSTTPMSVEVYLLEVTEQLKDWPEKGKRKIRWVSPKKAIKKLEEPGVVPLMQRLHEFEDALAKGQVPAA